MIMKKKCFSIRLLVAILLIPICISVFGQAKKTLKLPVADESLYGWPPKYPEGVTPPQYKSGVLGLKEYLSANIQYPKEHKGAREQGRVIVRFLVDKTGKVTRPVVVKSASPLFDAEALRVVRNMEDWTPGTGSNGEPISIWYHIPITFRLDNAAVVEPRIRHLDLTSIFGHQMSHSYLSTHVGKPFGMSERIINDEHVDIYFYYDRGDDVLKVGENRGLYFCDIASPRFTLFDGYIKVGIDCPKDLFEHGWTLIGTKLRRDRIHVTQIYNVPSLHAQVALVINKKNGTISYFKVSRQDESMACNNKIHI